MGGNVVWKEIKVLGGKNTELQSCNLTSTLCPVPDQQRAIVKVI